MRILVIGASPLFAWYRLKPLRWPIMRILLLNGPNLNLLGTRSPEVYGATTLDELETECRVRAAEYGHRLEAFQSNYEGALIDAIHAARETADSIVFNPGAFTHTSYALRDAIEAVELPTVEVHISNVAEREPWRRISLIQPACVYRIFGRGVPGYLSAISHLHYRSAHPPVTLGYGEDPDQVGDLRMPDGPGPHPVAVLIHGGGWTGAFTRDTMDGAAVDLTEHGVVTWNIEYRRIPPIGGWRATLDDVTAAVDALDSLTAGHPINPDDLTVIGHSAGGHLGFFAAKNARRRPGRFISLAGMLDLRRLGTDFDNLLAGFMGDELETHLDQIDPVRQVPCNVPIMAVHGRRDDTVDPEQSRRFVETALSVGDDALSVELDAAGHWDLIDPLSPVWERVVSACLGRGPHTAVGGIS